MFDKTVSRVFGKKTVYDSLVFRRIYRTGGIENASARPEISDRSRKDSVLNFGKTYDIRKLLVTYLWLFGNYAEKTRFFFVEK